MSSINIRNDSSQIAWVNLWGRKVGEIQRYSSDTFGGRNFEEFRIYNPDGNDFAVGDLFVQIARGEIMTSQPFNPQWDVLEDDLDRFATGCDSRIAYSSLVTADTIKYWLNVHNRLIIQRKLDVLGGAAVGEYEISMEEEKITGSTAAAFPTVDTKRYRKTLVNSGFDYSLSNCSIKGWVFDLRINPNDTMKNATPVSGASGEDAFDDDMSTFAGEYSQSGAAVGVHWEVSFDEVDILSFHYFLNMKAYGYLTKKAYTRLQLKVDGTWVTIEEVKADAGGAPSLSNTTFRKHDVTGWSKVTGVRVAYDLNDATNYSKTSINDITTLSEA